MVHSVKPVSYHCTPVTFSFIQRIDAHRQQTQLDKVIAKKQRIATKMKQEQAEAQQFCKMMRSHQLQQDHKVAALQQKLCEVPQNLRLQNAESYQQSASDARMLFAARDQHRKGSA